MHTHVSTKAALEFAAYYIIVRLFILFITTRWPDTAVGKALTVLG